MPTAFITIFFIMLTGVELGYTTLETLFAKAKTVSTAKGVLQMINLQKLIDQLAKGKNFVTGFFAKFLDVHKTIPTQLGLPLKLSVDGTRALLVDVFVKANIKGIAVKGEPVNGNATAGVRQVYFQDIMLHVQRTFDEQI